ncbi:hypothetical protein CFI10_13690 [Marinobacterium iners]|uniref:hypothetical protein n=1 Tax=Marinobacterium iners TaxID=48076 RepID=UPI001A8FC06D|nr:hypothetical protein [Marinobacterium iners]QSR36033.1 hypothetical protein CFI10_13690 [Marinobacterium iners]
MRLTPKQHQIIVTTLCRYFGQNSRILLLGSRVDDNARGGDIDLYIEPGLTDADQLEHHHRRHRLPGPIQRGTAGFL